MPNLSQMKRDRMLAFLQKIKDEHRDDDDILIALGEIESELTSKKYGLVWEQHDEAVDVMMHMLMTLTVSIIASGFPLCVKDKKLQEVC